MRRRATRGSSSLHGERTTGIQLTECTLCLVHLQAELFKLVLKLSAFFLSLVQVLVQCLAKLLLLTLVLNRKDCTRKGHLWFWILNCIKLHSITSHSITNASHSDKSGSCAIYESTSLLANDPHNYGFVPQTHNGEQIAQRGMEHA